MTQITFEPSNNNIYFHRKNRCIFYKRDVLKGLAATVKNERLKLSISVQKSRKNPFLCCPAWTNSALSSSSSKKSTHPQQSRYHLKRSRLFSTECCPLLASDKTGSCACHTQIFGPRRIWKLQCERDLSMQCLCRHSWEAQVFPYEPGAGGSDFQKKFFQLALGNAEGKEKKKKKKKVQEFSFQIKF